MAAERILVVDDEVMNRDLLEQILVRAGYEVSTAADGETALAMLRQGTFHIVLTDMRMPGMDGLAVIREMKTLAPSTIGIVHTAYSSVATAVEAMKAGAYDYVTKPVRRDELLVVLQRALEFYRLHSENIGLRQQLKAKYKFDNIVSDNEKMQAIFSQVERVSNTDSTVLIYGESGTGKELIARAIHYNSHRQDKALVTINCGAIPKDLLESELFGHEKGAFTGATALRQGRFELANGGTIFLDEIGELDLSLQVKLLRILQEREFERVGGTRTIKVDIRVLAATNKNLETLVAQQQFRDDLYWRLHVIPLTLPPLRERLSDLPLLIAHFITRCNVEKKCQLRGITPEALQMLSGYHWPGNIRELENMIERIAILQGDGVITPGSLPEQVFRTHTSNLVPVVTIPPEGIHFDATIEAFEQQLLLKALVTAGGNKSLAAKLLHMNRTTLIEKVKKLHLGDL